MNALPTNGSRFNLLPMNIISREMSRWIDDLTSEESCRCAAPVSIAEFDTHYLLEFDLPGVDVDDVELKVVENVLHFSATREAPAETNFVRQERTFGSIERQFNLPSRIDESGIGAEMNSGVLSVTIPKAPESQVKTIEIKGN